MDEKPKVLLSDRETIVDRTPLLRMKFTDYRIIALHFLLKLGNYICEICDQEIETSNLRSIHIDHKKPLYLGGDRHNIKNLRAVHAKCNLSRGIGGILRIKCKRGHFYSKDGYVVKNGRLKGTRRCKICKQISNLAYLERKKCQ